MSRMRDKKQKITLSPEEIKKVQQELFNFGVLEEHKEYRIKKEYLEEFLSTYSERSGRYGYIQEAIIFPLFDLMKEKNPSISEEELTDQAQRFYPVIRAMLDQEGVFKLIRKVSKMRNRELDHER